MTLLFGVCGIAMHTVDIVNNLFCRRTLERRGVERGPRPDYCLGNIDLPKGCRFDRRRLRRDLGSPSGAVIGRATHQHAA